jgi:uncharacterized delta-60 repeat protein
MVALVPRHTGVRCLLFALVLAAAMAVLAPVAQAAPGDLDPTFGSGGSEQLFQNPENLFLGAVTTQPDGKIVMAGDTEAGVLVARLFEDGSFDPSFGGSGFVVTGGMGTFAGASAVVVQPDGKIVIAGSTQVAGKEEFLVARYLSGGQLDPDFGGGDGFVSFPVGTKDAEARALAIGAGERILVTGEAENAGAHEVVAVAVLSPSGEFDPSFSGDGVTTVESPGGDDRGEGIAEAPGGGIVIADDSGAGAGHGFTVVKLLPDGTPDSAFGTAGIAQTLIPGSTAGRCTSIALLPDGRIVAAGYGFDEPAPGKLDAKFAAVRYLVDGKLDPSFGNGTGIFTQQVGSGDDSARFVALTPSGKTILAGAYESAENNVSPAALRLTTDGALDPTFGNGGIVRRPVLAPFGDYLEGAALDERERLVTVSSAYEGNNMVSFEVTRLLGDIPPSAPQAVAAPKPPPASNLPPHARIKKFGKAVDAAKLKAFSGTAADPEGEPLRKVQIALVRKVPPERKAQATPAGAKKVAGKSCLDLRNAKGGFKLVHAKQGKPCPLLWLDAKGTTKWSFHLTGALPVGSYVLSARAVDAKGLAGSTFSAAAGNRLAFRITVG